LADLKAMMMGWSDRNPLYAWRSSNGLSRNAVAALVGSSLNSVINWERGGSIPTDEKIEAIARAMNKNSGVLRREWDEWLQEVYERTE